MSKRTSDLVKRYGDWCQTFTGRKFHPLDPRPEDFCIEDIAHALSNLCRFNGHCKHFYSVAQHSVFVSRHVEREFKASGASEEDILAASFWGLMHDAAEAYLSDVPRPLKRSDEMAWFRIQEMKMLNDIKNAFGLGPYVHEVDEVDLRMLLTEKRDIMVDPPADWLIPGEPYEERIECRNPEDAEIMFIVRYKELVTRQKWLQKNSEG